MRKATWHPSGTYLVSTIPPGWRRVLTTEQTTCGADGKIIIWDVSADDAKEEKVIDGVIPAVADTE